jgi:acetolactate synthase-1/2/3 large subunit
MPPGAVDLLWSARKPPSSAVARAGPDPRWYGRSMRCRPPISTPASRAARLETHPGVVAAMRGSVMAGRRRLTVGRRLDLLAYGSPAVFGPALRAHCGRRGGCATIVAAMSAARRLRSALMRLSRGCGRCEYADGAANELARAPRRACRSPRRDGEALSTRRDASIRIACSRASRRGPAGGYRRRRRRRPSFARVGTPAAAWLDPGSLGCIGVGTPFGIAASSRVPTGPWSW